MPTINYIYHGNQYLCETDENDTPTKLYVNEPGTYTNLVSQKDLATEEKSYPLYDALGSTRAVTDDNGDVTDTFVYDAWGNVLDRTGTTDISFQYVGQYGYYRDEETETNYVMARTYNPRIIRWLSVDPIGLEGGVNVYAYATNNSLLFIDPSGLKVHVFAWEGTLGTGLLSSGILAVNSALKNFYKPIVDQYPDAVWHYNSQKSFNPVGFLIDLHEIKRVALKTEAPVYPCCYPRIVFLGYSWGGQSAAMAVKELSEEKDPKKRIIVDAVFTIDPVFGRWWISTPWKEDASTFNNFCEWESHFQTVDSKSLLAGLLGVRGSRAIKGDTITGALNISVNNAFPAGMAGTGTASDPEIAHIGIPQQARVRSAFRQMLASFFRVKGIRRKSCCGTAVDCPVRACL